MPSASSSSSQPTNHLVNSKSPYLLQHKHDPVDWHEFNDLAFKKAQSEGKLVFLSIGYSSCHWCHQMRYDSFSSQQVADALNRDFVSIKVDREERPDVDATYMQFVMALNRSGGWPLSAFLTPDAKPLFGGTFFPRQQFLKLLDRLSTMWEDDRQSCLNSANSIAAQLSQQLGPHSGTKLDNLPDDSLAIKAAENWMKRFDNEHGGFGSAPKFPTVSNTHHLLHRIVSVAKKSKKSEQWASTETKQLADNALQASVFTLLKISRGGITDQIAGGIARYSVDEEWRVPHFEKMLYDQGQLLSIFCEGIQLAKQSGDSKLLEMVPELEATAEGIVRYLKTDLSHPGGGFFSAEDADSFPTMESQKKKEGAFYVWTLKEVKDLLGKDSDETKVVTRQYALEVDGNIPAESDPHGELTGTNMLHAVDSIAETATGLGMGLEAAIAALKAAKDKLLAKRDADRPRPHLDDKIISAWNGLAISGLCKAAEVLGDRGQHAQEMAVKAADFILENLYNAKRNRLRRSWREGDAGPWGFSSDYAFLTQAMLDLFELTGEPRYLDMAIKLQTRLDQGFWDEDVGGYFISEDILDDGDGSRLLTRQKEEQDGAEPSAASVAAHNLMRLSWMFDSQPVEGMPWTERRDTIIKSGGFVLQRAPFALGTLTTALLGVRDGGTQILLNGKGEEMLSAIRSRFMPYRTLIMVQGDKTKYDVLSQHNSAVKEALGKNSVEAHICRNFACGLPLKDVPSLIRALQEE